MGEVIRKITRATIIVLAVIVLLNTASADAQSNGLGILPRKDFTVEAGKSLKDTLYISNLSRDQDLQVRMRIIDFGHQNETGAPALHINDDAPQTPWSLKPFLTIPASITIAAGEAVNVPISITVPASQGAGSYYSAIEYIAVNPETKQRVNIAASTVTLVFMTVPGDAKELLILKKFGTWISDASQVDGKFAADFIGSAPKEFAYRLQNEGNVAEQPAGNIVIKNIFGRTVKLIDEANPKKQLALMGQTRRFQLCIRERIMTLKNPDTGHVSKTSVCDDPRLFPGRYTAEMSLYYSLNGNNTQEVRAVASFWYFPWWSIAGFVVLLLLAALIFIRPAYRALIGNHRRLRR